MFTKPRLIIFITPVCYILIVQLGVDGAVLDKTSWNDSRKYEMVLPKYVKDKESLNILVPLNTKTVKGWLNFRDKADTFLQNPCLNGGHLFANGPQYACFCEEGYSGEHCQIHTNICADPILHGKNFPCVSDNLSCRPTFGGGFTCNKPYITPANNVLQKHCTEHSCPKTWLCFDMYVFNKMYRCQPPFHEAALRTGRDFCSQNLCKHGSQCVNSSCICMPHFTGKYCENEVNYCMQNRCPKGFQCQPFLGGYNCLCPRMRVGIHCTDRRSSFIKRLSQPHFLYHRTQYTDFDYSYWFYVVSLGTDLELFIHMEQSVIIHVKEKNFTFIKDTTEIFKNFALLPTSLPSASLFAFKFQHTYSVPGLHNITVSARNYKYKVYNSVHTVKVQHINQCQIITKLHNCAQSVNTPITYDRTSHIVIFASSKVQCSNSELRHSWKLYKLTNFVTIPYHDWFINVLNTENSPTFEVLPYSLPFGKYGVVYDVIVNHSPCPVTANATTWFTVLKLPLQPRLKGGSVIYSQFDSSLTLDASETYDPNMPSCHQPSWKFQWYCVCENGSDEYNNNSDYCKGMTTALKGNKSQLIIPPHSLKLHNYYTFIVKCIAISEEAVEMAQTQQRVKIVDSQTPVLRIRCLQNCQKLKQDPYDVTNIMAECHSCLTSLGKIDNKKWYILDENNTIMKKITDNFEFELNNPNLIAYENVFQSGKIYRIVFKAADYFVVDKLLNNKLKDKVALKRQSAYHNYNNFKPFGLIQPSSYDTEMQQHKNEDRKNSFKKAFVKTTKGMEVTVGAVEEILQFNKPPVNGYCLVVPQIGFASITSFTISCNGFFDSEQPLQYEITYISNLSNPYFNSFVVGYDVGSEINDIILPPGLEQFNYVVKLKIFVTDSLGVYSHYEYSVTVFPVHFFFKDPHDTLIHFYHIMSGEDSSFHKMLNVGDARNIIQSAVTVSLSVQDFVKNIKNFKQKEIEKLQTVTKETLASYLSAVDVTNIIGLKHLCHAIYNVLNGGKLNTNLYSTKIGQEVLTRIIDIITSKVINKLDIQEIGLCILSVARLLLQEPQDLTDQQQSTGSYNENRFKNNNCIWKNFRRQNFVTYTQKILEDIRKFAFYFLKYKVVNERASIFHLPGIQLFVKKTYAHQLHKTNLFMKGKVMINLDSLDFWHRDSEMINIFVLHLDKCPYWWYSTPNLLSYPYIQSEVKTEDARSIQAPFHIKVNLQKMSHHPTTRDIFDIPFYWNNFDVQVYRVVVPRGEKLLVEFFPYKYSFKMNIVIKKDVPPQVRDFWGSEERSSFRKTQSNRNLFIVFDELSFSDDDLFYIGILPEIEYFQNFYKATGIRNTHYHNNVKHLYNSVDYKISKIQEEMNHSLEYEFITYTAKCVLWNGSKVRSWIDGCTVLPSSSPKNIECNCIPASNISVFLRHVTAKLHRFQKVHLILGTSESSLVLFFVLYCSLIFVVTHFWAFLKDRKDFLKRDVIFLADNSPDHSYCYLIKVKTGWGSGAATTSHVAIQLQGDQSKSQIHILNSSKSNTLCSNSQDWFVIKTAASIGNIVWIHLWTDYLGACPNWFCEDILIHDIQTNNVWFFDIRCNFSPLSYDGSVSCSVRKSSHSSIFLITKRMRNSILGNIGHGHYCLISIFKRHTYSNFTRCQRVGVAAAHFAILLLMSVHRTDLFTSDDFGDQTDSDFESYYLFNCAYEGLMVSLVTCPVTFLLSLLFMHVNPLPKWKAMSLLHRGFKSAYIQKQSEMAVGEKISSLKKNVNTSFSKGSLDVSKEINDNNTYRTNIKEDKCRFLNCDKQKSNNIFPLRHIREWCEEDTELVPYWNERTVALGNTEGLYCLPHFCIYVCWVLVLSIVITCTYISLLYGLSYNWRKSVMFLTTSLIAFLIILFIIEPSKLLLFACYSVATDRKTMAIEDRSDIVVFRNQSFASEDNKSDPTAKSNFKRREEQMYRPLSKVMVSLLKKNCWSETKMKSVISDITVFLIFFIILSCIVRNIGETMGYYNIFNVKNLMIGRKGAEKISLDEIKNRDDFYTYMYTVFIPTIYDNKLNTNDLQENSQPSVGMINYLIGVPRIRQLRNMHETGSQRTNVYDWYNQTEGDTKNYMETWKELDDMKFWYEDCYETKVSHYQSGEPSNSFNMKSNDVGESVELLSRSKQKSLAVIDNMRKTNWFDELTKILFLEFSLYNPNRYLVSTVSILVEISINGYYTNHIFIEQLKVKPINFISEVFVIAMTCILIILTLYYINQKIRKVNHLSDTRYCGTVWRFLDLILIFLCVTIIVLFLVRTVLLTFAYKQIYNTNEDQFVNFTHILDWDYATRSASAITLVLIFIKLWHIVAVKMHLRLLKNISRLAVKPIYWYFLAIVLSLVAMTFAFYITFNQKLPDLQNFFVTTLQFTCSKHYISQLRLYINEAKCDYFVSLMFMVFVTFLGIFIFLLKCLIVAVILSVFPFVKAVAIDESKRPVATSFRKIPMNVILNIFEKKVLTDTVTLKKYASVSENAKVRVLAMEYVTKLLLKTYQQNGFKLRDLKLSRTSIICKSRAGSMASIVTGLQNMTKKINQEKLEIEKFVILLPKSTGNSCSLKQKEILYVLRTHFLLLYIDRILSMIFLTTNQLTQRPE